MNGHWSKDGWDTSLRLDVPGDLLQSLIQEAEQSGLPLEALTVQLLTAADRSERTIIHMGKLEDTR